MVAHSPHAENYRQFLHIQPSTRVPIILPLWSRDEVLDLWKVAYAGMTEKQVHTWQSVSSGCIVSG